jgi:hypothetical protein
MEMSAHVGISLFSINERLHHKWEYHQWSGLGKQNGAILFDPRDASFMANVIQEYRFSFAKLQTGLEHPCFHQIDRKDSPTVYWNKLFIGVESNRTYGFQNFDTINAENFYERFNWQIRWGYFLRNFGDINPDVLIARTLDYKHDLLLNCRYNFFSWRHLFMYIDGNTLLGSKKDGTYWSQTFGTELHYRNNRFTSVLFVKYTLDDNVNIVLGKDRLLQVGFKLYK